MIILTISCACSCCVDEVAAEHYSIDAIVHYGHACLSPIRNLPVFFVFGKHQIDAERCSSLVRSAVGVENCDQHLVLLYDVIYHHAIGKW